jgi:hypothetical protein
MPSPRPWVTRKQSSSAEAQRAWSVAMMGLLRDTGSVAAYQSSKHAYFDSLDAAIVIGKMASLMRFATFCFYLSFLLVQAPHTFQQHLTMSCPPSAHGPNAVCQYLDHLLYQYHRPSQKLLHEAPRHTGDLEGQEASSISLSGLPPELRQAIMSFLDYPSLASLCATNHDCYHLPTPAITRTSLRRLELDEDLSIDHLSHRGIH